ncbi:hypothetical protein [Pseudogulbenkiania subflava]|uniref:Uncharacterized protein n=1 Tax=Pseudogulbenkiania subflava DSM 22618 TaxID=1123014 RepID=A0A1Y6C988_9NEIS|nr:hypothetical protein [Pseudogulbenkiania subflava]SMF52450.1 hypothetical protein SAMN02745746_03768 [Pseudogulbenkiania subflava DSM 22618]
METKKTLPVGEPLPAATWHPIGKIKLGKPLPETPEWLLKQAVNDEQYANEK